MTNGTWVRKEAIELEIENTKTGHRLTAYLHDELLRQYAADIVRIIWEKVATRIADEIVKQHGSEIMAKLDMKAIANTTIAQAGNKMSEALRGRWE